MSFFVAAAWALTLKMSAAPTLAICFVLFSLKKSGALLHKHNTEKRDI